MNRALAIAVVGTIGFGGCGDDPLDSEIVGPCDATVTHVPAQPGVHVQVGTPIARNHNPPANGNHYPVWAAWDRSYDDLDRGYWVHNAEHGGLILLHHCDGDCPAVVDQLLAVARGLPTDPLCVAPVRNRVLVASDPLLPVGVVVAAVAWGVTYTATCFDDSVRTFAAANIAKGPEKTCADGLATGGTFIDP